MRGRLVLVGLFVLLVALNALYGGNVPTDCP